MKKSTRNLIIITCSFAVFLLAVLTRTTRYLPDTPDLFYVTTITRVTIATAFGVGVAILLFIYRKFFSHSSRDVGLKVLRDSSVVIAAVACLMSISSIGSDIPNGMLQLYVMH